MKFVDVKNDVAFRKIFGNENKKNILISFLNAVLKLKNDRRIKSIEILNPFQAPEIKGLKDTILDLKVKDERGISYIIEMQVVEKLGFEKRVQYYVSKEYSSQIGRGEEYPKLNQVIFIGILNFNFFYGNSYLTHHLILNEETLKQELKDLEFNFIELPKFMKKESELVSLVEKWIYFIKNVENLEIIPDNIKDKGLLEAYNDASMFNWDKEELRLYDYMSMRKQDRRGEFELAVKRGIEKRIKEVTEKGIEKGMEKVKIKVAKEMKDSGESLEKIKKYTGLSKEVIKKLK